MLVFFALFVSPAARGAMPPPVLRESPPQNSIGNRASRRLMEARNHTRGYSVPKEGTFDHCMAELGSHISNDSNGTLTQTCTDWHEAVENMFRALDVLRNNATMIATFGSRSALASMMVGAISAARMDISEYSIEGEINIRKWRSDIDKAINQLIVDRSISDGGLIVGPLVCCVSAYACIPAIIVSQLVQLGFEFPTYTVIEKLDALLRNPRKNMTPYLTENGKKVNALLDFVRITNDLNETKQGGLVFLGKMLMTYVSTTIASNATKTVADVLGDLETMSRMDMNANVKMFAGMMFNYTNDPPNLTKITITNTVVRGLLTTGVLADIVIFVLFFLEDFKLDKRIYRDALRDLPATEASLAGILGIEEGFLEEAKKRLQAREDLINRIKSGLVTEEDMLRFNIYPESDRRFKEVPYAERNARNTIVEEESGSVAHESMYKFTGAQRSVILQNTLLNDARTGMFTTNTLSPISLRHLEDTVTLANKRSGLMRITATKPHLFDGRWNFMEYGLAGGVAFGLSFASAALDGVATTQQIHDVGEYVSSIASVANRDMNDTMDVLQMWQDLHKSRV